MAGEEADRKEEALMLLLALLPTHAPLHSKFLFKRAHSSSTYIRQPQLSAAAHPSHNTPTRTPLTLPEFSSRIFFCLSTATVQPYPSPANARSLHSPSIVLPHPLCTLQDPARVPNTFHLLLLSHQLGDNKTRPARKTPTTWLPSQSPLRLMHAPAARTGSVSSFFRAPARRMD